jgi:hypothetical protein
MWLIAVHGCSHLLLSLLHSGAFAAWRPGARFRASSVLQWVSTMIILCLQPESEGYRQQKNAMIIVPFLNLAWRSALEQYAPAATRSAPFLLVFCTISGAAR